MTIDATVAVPTSHTVGQNESMITSLTGRLLLIDEVLTPDSSRFWPRQSYAAGRGQPSLDKQPLRDWLETQEWDKQPPPPPLPTRRSR